MQKIDSELLYQQERLFSQANELSQSLAVPSIGTVEIPQVRFERRQDWGMEAVVDLQLLPVQRRLRLSVTLCRAITVKNFVV